MFHLLCKKKPFADNSYLLWTMGMQTNYSGTCLSLTVLVFGENWSTRQPWAGWQIIRYLMVLLVDCEITALQSDPLDYLLSNTTFLTVECDLGIPIPNYFNLVIQHVLIRNDLYPSILHVIFLVDFE